MLALLQEWIDLEGTGSTGDFYQSGSSWLDLSGYQDVIFYLDVQYTPAGGQLFMNYETAPANEPAMFVNMVSSFQVLGGSTVTPVFLSANPTVPLAPTKSGSQRAIPRRTSGIDD